MDHKSLVFASVFPVPSFTHTTPTPIATPNIAFSAPGQSFGGPTSSSGTGQHRDVKRSLAWSTATRFLSLPKPDQDEDAQLQPTISRPISKDSDVLEALTYLLIGEGQCIEGSEEGLLDWYTNEVRIHFVTYVQPALQALWNAEIECRNALNILHETHRILHQVQNLYLQPFLDHVLPVIQQNSNDSVATLPSDEIKEADPAFVKWKLQRDIRALFAHSLPPQRFSKTLGYVLYDAGCKHFGIYIDRGSGLSATPVSQDIPASREILIRLLHGLADVGLGGDNAQKAFAHAMDKIMGSFIVSHYLKVDWYSRKPVVADLRTWINLGFSPMVSSVMECLSSPSSVQPAELQQWQDMALGRLGRARVENLFDFVIHWDKSLGAILDIKEYLKLPGAKSYLTSHFSQQVSRRLLHPGATTTYVLNVYIYIIRAFNELEPKGVLLERVARPIRRYLREREDTARIIISSLLTDLEDETGSKFASGSELSYEIASEMQKPIANFAQDQDEELNWGDMNWQPHPTDASPDYKKSKVEDVIWFLLTLWDREDFINELKNILGDHLLRSQDPDYEREIRLLELIKLRLGDEKLQACEVMLRDVLDSKRINASIRAGEDQPLGTAAQPPPTPGDGPKTPQTRPPPTSVPVLEAPTMLSQKPAPDQQILNAQILSSFFWPPLREDEFLVPAPVHALQQAYETRFERVKGMRKLRWLSALGRVKVELQLEDRSVGAEVQTWQASVIYAFQPQEGEEFVGKGKARKGQSITRNVDELVEKLQMDEALVRQALGFWIGKSVLRETHPDTYTVIERLSTSTDDAAAAAAAKETAEVQAQAQASAVVSQTDLLMQNKELYRNFVVGMLTNQGNMPTARILMMLKMAVPGGFPYGADELKLVLGELVAEGKLGASGDVYGVRKE